MELHLTLTGDLSPELALLVARLTRWLDRQEADAISATPPAATPAATPKPDVPRPALVLPWAEKACAVVPAAASRPGPDWNTQARRDLVAEHYPAGLQTRDLRARLNALPGPQVTLRRLHDMAELLGVMRPPGFVPLAEWHTEARRALMAQHYSAGLPIAELLPRLNALPGPPMTVRRIYDLAKAMGLKRPAGTIGTRKAPMAAPTAAPPPATPHAPRQAAPVVRPPPPAAVAPVQAKPAPPIAPYIRPTPPAPPVPPPQSPAQRQRDADAALIAAHVAQRGVTRCPTGVAAPTTATLPPADAAAQRDRNNARQDAEQAASLAEGQRIARNRGLRLAGKLPTAKPGVRKTPPRDMADGSVRHGC